MKTDEELRQIFKQEVDCFDELSGVRQYTMTEDRFIEVIHKLSPIKVVIIGGKSMIPGEIGRIEELLDTIKHLNPTLIVAGEISNDLYEEGIPRSTQDDKPYLIHSNPCYNDPTIGIVRQRDLNELKNWKQQNKFRQRFHSSLGRKGR